MFGSLSPHKQLVSPKGGNAKPIEEIRRIRSGLSTSPRGLASPSKPGKKIEDTGIVQIEVSQDDHSDRPKFPIRIPVEQMKPKRDYLAQVRKSETNLDTRPSTAKQSKTDIHEKPGPRRTSEAAKGRSQRDPQSLNKRASIPKSEQMKLKTAGTRENTAVDAQDLKRIIENIVDYKFKTYGGNNRALETQKSASNLSMDMSMRKRPNSSRRPLSSRTSNKKKPKNTESYRASSKKERKETEYSRMSQIPQEPINPEEAKKEQLLRTKKIVIENLKKFSREQKEKEEQKMGTHQEKTLKREGIRKMNERIRLENEKSPVEKQKSVSPLKHKYDWGADQKRLEMKPERKQSGKKWEKKDPTARRQEIGLSHLNDLEDIALKKAKIETKEKAAKILKEAEDKYKIKRKEKTEEEKEKLKLLIREQIEKKKKAQLDNKAKTLQDKEIKKQRLDALFKNVAEIQAKDLAEKKEAEKNKPKKVVKKRSKRTSEAQESTSSLPNEEDISNARGRIQGKRPSESKRKAEEEEEYEEDVEEEVVGLNEEDLYMLDELFERIDIRIESKLLLAGFSKLKAFSEQMNRKVEQQRKAEQEKAKAQQQQRQQQQQQQQQQQAQLKQQQQNQAQIQQAGKAKAAVTFNDSNHKGKIEAEKMSSQKQKLIESEKRQKAAAQVDDYEIEEDQYQEVYITKPLKESNLPPKQSMAEKGKQRSDTTSKKLEFRDDRDEGTGYRIYNPKSAEKYKNSMKENTRKEEGVIPPEGVDFDEMLFNLTSEELIKLPYFSIVK